MFARLTSTIIPRARVAQLSSQFQFKHTMASIPKTMKGVLVEKTGGVEVLQYKTDLPVPTPKDGEVLVKNDFIGINYIDTYFPLSQLPSTKPLPFLSLYLQCQQLFPHRSLPISKTRNPRPRSRRHNRLHRRRQSVQPESR
jgi:hypothetical protein